MGFPETEESASLEVEPDADKPGGCEKSISNSRLRSYLFRLRSDSPDNDDISLAEHIVRCEPCQGAVEELYCFEDALRYDYQDLAPVLRAEVHTSAAELVAHSAAGLEIGELQEHLENKILSGIEFARRIDQLDREYEMAFRSNRLPSFQASCKAEFDRIDPGRSSALSSELRESMIDLITGRCGSGNKQRLLDIPVAKKHPIEFLLGYSSTNRVLNGRQRAWYRDPDVADPLGIVIEAGYAAVASI